MVSEIKNLYSGYHVAYQPRESEFLLKNLDQKMEFSLKGKNSKRKQASTLTEVDVIFSITMVSTYISEIEIFGIIFENGKIFEISHLLSDFDNICYVDTYNHYKLSLSPKYWNFLILVEINKFENDKHFEHFYFPSILIKCFLHSYHLYCDCLDPGSVRIMKCLYCASIFCYECFFLYLRN